LLVVAGVGSSGMIGIGQPKSVRLLSTFERGGMAHRELEFEFEKTSLDADLYRTPDGKVQEFLLYAK
jgi:hypothetical protein